MMKHPLFPLLLCVALLCGCAAQNPEPPVLTAPTEMTEETAPVPKELTMTPVSDQPALQEYRLSENVTGFLPLGENLLLFSGEEQTALRLLNPETGEALTVHETPLVLTPENATVQLLETGISYFSPADRKTVVLDNALREIRRIAVPEDLTGMPLLSRDGGTLYYCTADAVRCMDLDSGISRVLKEASHLVQSVTALLLEDSVVQLSITDSDGTWRTLFLSAETGQLLGDYEGNILPETVESSYFLCLQEGGLKTLLFGSDGTSPMVLNTANDAADCRLLGSQAVILEWVGMEEQLGLYDLDYGYRTAVLTGFSGTGLRNMVQDQNGMIWFLCDHDDGTVLLCRWDPSLSQTGDSRVYTAPYFTRENPDYDGLAACSLYAQQISEKYGIEVLVYRDAATLEPWDYHLEYEYQASVLQQELEALDRRLGNYPAGFLQTLADKFTALKICIVRSAVGSPESGSLEAVNGIQFFDGYDAYIILASDHDTEYALYHELSHLVETVVLTESTAYDQWELLNPSDFRYDYDYVSNRTRDGSPWLQEGTECFIDTYSMSFPKEDRARIMEYAMTEGNAHRFQSLYMQAKLQRLCTGIREAFGLKKSEETFLWEQYLAEPLS